MSAGPDLWRFNPAGAFVRDAADRAVASVYGHEGASDIAAPGVTERGLLIAAAPSLYASASAIDALIRECLLGATKLADDDERIARVDRAVADLRAALAKAVQS